MLEQKENRDKRRKKMRHRLIVQWFRDRSARSYTRYLETHMKSVSCGLRHCLRKISRSHLGRDYDAMDLSTLLLWTPRRRHGTGSLASVTWCASSSQRHPLPCD